MKQYEERLAASATRVNDALRELLRAPAGCRQMLVIDAMRYSVLDAGKRIRAALLLEFARLARAPWAGSTQLSCAIEMVHAYSLIHDDLPCMDNDDMRRGKPSCHKKYGEAIALLAGDGLLTLAFETAATVPLDDSRKVRAVQTLARAAGAFGMIGGQTLDLSSGGHNANSTTKDDLMMIDRMKTGALLRASVEMGCISGQDGESLMSPANYYAENFGLAFQITDDILDVTGDPDKLGKLTGSDEINQKVTYVTMLGLDGARKEARQRVEKAKDAVAGIEDNGFLLWLADSVLTRDH